MLRGLPATQRRVLRSAEASTCKWLSVLQPQSRPKSTTHLARRKGTCRRRLHQLHHLAAAVLARDTWDFWQTWQSWEGALERGSVPALAASGLRTGHGSRGQAGGSALAVSSEGLCTICVSSHMYRGRLWTARHAPFLGCHMRAIHRLHDSVRRREQQDADRKRLRARVWGGRACVRACVRAEADREHLAERAGSSMGSRTLCASR